MAKQTPLPGLKKTRTGIPGFDEITNGGLPTGRPSLICGDAGAGKTLFSIEFIVRGALQFNEPGVIMTFEEKPEDLESNVSSLGFDLKKLQKDKQIWIDHVHIDRSEIEETGVYDLDGLFIRLAHAIDSIKAKRVMLDTIENLFGGLKNEGILRGELRRLFTWLKDKGVTTIITGEKGEKMLTRQGLEEYVSDCVILLEHRIVNQISTRLLRIVKYRGSLHGTNEYPFLIDEEGISVLPVTSLQLSSNVSNEKLSSGLLTLDFMLGGAGFYRGSTILVSGTPGTGKTNFAASFADGACKRKERCMYIALEESPQQIVRNVASIGIDLQQHIDSGLLNLKASRPTLHGLEMHLVNIHKLVKKFKPNVVVLDPVTNLTTIGSLGEVKSMLTRLIDFLQNEGITFLITALVYGNDHSVQTDEGISSLVDVWILLREIEANGERNRAMYIMKSRGMKHSNRVREFHISDHGIELLDIYLGPNGILVGSARETEELNETARRELRDHALTRKDQQIKRKQLILEAKIASLKEEFESVQDELNKTFVEEELKKEIINRKRQEVTGTPKNGNAKSKKK